MKSSEGQHFVGLDHVRAVAIFIVFSYHFLTAANGGVHSAVSTFPLNAIFSEGYTGVSLFMTLSGYLFTRLAVGRDIKLGAFLFNRMLRLGPLLTLVLVIQYGSLIVADPASWTTQVLAVLIGFVAPTWPNGAWSTTCEFHFYLVFPLLIAVLRWQPSYLLVIVAVAILIRLAIYGFLGGQQVQDAAYWTIIGRIDQFVLGMTLANHTGWFADRHKLAATTAITGVILWAIFAGTGGWNDTDHQWVWIFLTPSEGLFYAVLIAYYDASYRMPITGLSLAVAKIGEWSFSIYLLQFFFIAAFVRLIERQGASLDNFYVAMGFAVPTFLLMSMIGWISYAVIEKPMLRYRVPYFSTSDPKRPVLH